MNKKKEAFSINKVVLLPAPANPRSCVDQWLSSSTRQSTTGGPTVQQCNNLGIANTDTCCAPRSKRAKSVPFSQHIVSHVSRPIIIIIISLSLFLSHPPFYFCLVLLFSFFFFCASTHAPFSTGCIRPNPAGSPERDIDSRLTPTSPVQIQIFGLATRTLFSSLGIIIFFRRDREFLIIETC